MLDVAKERMKRIDAEAAVQIEENRHCVLRKYRAQLDANSFSVQEIVSLVTNFNRKSSAYSARIQLSPNFLTPNSQFLEKQPSVGGSHNRLLASLQQRSAVKPAVSVQMLIQKQKQQLARGAAARKRKALIQAENRELIKVLRKKAKRIYKCLDLQQFLREDQYCLSNTREQNIQSMYAQVLERNLQINKQRLHFEDQYRDFKERSGKQQSFRIKKKQSAGNQGQRKNTLVNTNNNSSNLNNQ